MAKRKVKTQSMLLKDKDLVKVIKNFTPSTPFSTSLKHYFDF